MRRHLTPGFLLAKDQVLGQNIILPGNLTYLITPTLFLSPSFIITLYVKCFYYFQQTWTKQCVGVNTSIQTVPSYSNVSPVKLANTSIVAGGNQVLNNVQHTRIAYMNKKQGHKITRVVCGITDIRNYTVLPKITIIE